MKRVTANEAHRDWFRILDEVAEGEVVVVEHNGQRIQLSRQGDEARVAPDYGKLIRAADDVAAADRWGWDRSGERDDLNSVDLGPS